MADNFFVTGTGRCGSQWLAHTLHAMLPDWTVRHELGSFPTRVQNRVSSNIFMRMEVVQTWISQQPKRGIVDCTLRPVAECVVSDRNVVLIRHPIRVWDSGFRRSPNKINAKRWLTPDMLLGMCYRIDDLVEKHGFAVLKFEDAINPVTGPACVARILDVPLGNEEWTVGRKNASPTRPHGRPDLEKLARAATVWFADKYELKDV